MRLMRGDNYQDTIRNGLGNGDAQLSRSQERLIGSDGDSSASHASAPTHFDDVLQHMDFEEIMQKMGRLGRYQIWQYVLLSLMTVPQSMVPFLITFVAGEDDFHCHIPANESLPKVDNGHGQMIVDSCHKYNQTSMDGDHLGAGIHNATVPPSTSLEIFLGTSPPVPDTIPCADSGYQYDTSTFGSTIVTEWSLVCDDEYLVPLIQTIYFFGVLVGNSVCPYLADVYGRKRMMVAFMLVQSLVGFALCLSQSYTVFVVIRFLVGVVQQGIQTVPTVFLIEIFAKEDRNLAAFLPALCWALGMILLAGLAFLLRSWRRLAAVVGLAYLPMAVVFIFFLERDVAAAKALRAAGGRGRGPTGRTPPLHAVRLRDLATDSQLFAIDSDTDDVDDTDELMEDHPRDVGGTERLRRPVTGAPRGLQNLSDTRPDTDRESVG